MYLKGINLMYLSVSSSWADYTHKLHVYALYKYE